MCKTGGQKAVAQKDNPASVKRTDFFSKPPCSTSRPDEPEAHAGAIRPGKASQTASNKYHREVPENAGYSSQRLTEKNTNQIPPLLFSSNRTMGTGLSYTMQPQGARDGVEKGRKEKKKMGNARWSSRLCSEHCTARLFHIPPRQQQSARRHKDAHFYGSHLGLLSPSSKADHASAPRRRTCMHARAVSIKRCSVLGAVASDRIPYSGTCTPRTAQMGFTTHFRMLVGHDIQRGDSRKE